MAEGFIQIKRSLLDHPCVVKAPVAQRWVLITIANHCCFKPTQMNDHGVLIDLDAGEFLCTVRELAKLANVEKNDVERALERFSNNLLVRQGVRHKKTVVSISKEYIVEYETRSETRSETRFYETKNGKVRQEVRQEVRQSRDTKEYSNTNKNVVVVVEKEKKEDVMKYSVVKKDFEGNDIICNQADYYAYISKKGFTWTVQEIEAAWEVLVDYPGFIRNWLTFMDGTIKKNNTHYSKKTKEIKPCKIQPLKQKQEKRKDFYSESDMSESPLAKFDSQMKANRRS